MPIPAGPLAPVLPTYRGAIAQFGRAPESHSGGRRFDPDWLHQNRIFPDAGGHASVSSFPGQITSPQLHARASAARFMRASFDAARALPPPRRRARSWAPAEMAWRGCYASQARGRSRARRSWYAHLDVYRPRPTRSATPKAKSSVASAAKETPHPELRPDPLDA
jgi:hypothetical protein